MASDSPEAPTQQIRRPGTTPRLPSGLDLTRSSDNARVDESTEVMSLDELMELAAEPRPDATTQQYVVPAPLLPPTAPPASVAPPRPAQPQLGRTDAAPAGSGGAPMHLLLDRMRADSRRVLDDAQHAAATGLTHVRQWLETNDNALIAATVLVTLLLLVVVAAL